MMNPVLGRIRDVVYQTLAGEGRAPSPAEIARVAGIEDADVLPGLRTLADQHALVLTPDGDAIRMAHPFSAAPMAFVVSPADGHDTRRWWGGCAWDSFGISAALDLDVLVDTSCPQCGGHLRVAAGPQTPPPPQLAVWYPRPAAQWWDDVVGTCSAIRMFCTVEEAEAWRTGEEGRVVPATTAWELAVPWYGDRLSPQFVPHTRSHNQALLDQVGLRGDFWRLP